MGLFGRKSAAEKKAAEAAKAAEAKRAEEAARAAAARRASAAAPVRSNTPTQSASGVHKATRLIKENFEAHGRKFTVDVKGDVSVVKIGFKGETAPGKDYYFFSADDDNDVTIRTEPIVRAPEDKVVMVLRALNQCNDEFRFVRFFMDDDRDIWMESDIPLKVADEDVGEVAHGLLLRMVAILDKAYPIIMKAIWAG